MTEKEAIELFEKAHFLQEQISMETDINGISNTLSLQFYLLIQLPLLLHFHMFGYGYTLEAIQITLYTTRLRKTIPLSLKFQECSDINQKTASCGCCPLPIT